MPGSTLKYIGLVLMVFDHVHQIFAMQGIPMWFHWMGRPVLPIFLFLCAEAFWHTRSRARYLARLFIGFELMQAGNLLLSRCMPVYQVTLDNNVFQTLFLAALYMLCIETLRAGKPVMGIVLGLLPIAGSFAPQPFCWYIPNVFLTEGSFGAVVLAVLLYVFRQNRLNQIAIIMAFGVVCIIFTVPNPHWLFMLSVIPIWLYNGKRGRAHTFFFYIFYPAHLYLLYGIARIFVQ